MKITRNTIGRWTAQTFIVASMTLAPAAIAVGLANSAHAAPATNDAGTSVSAPHRAFPGQHNAFPGQHNSPTPGTSIHHHHQHNHQ